MTEQEQGSLSFAGLLRRLRGEAKLTQEELAEAAGLSLRTVRDLERGIHSTARKNTALLLAEAVGMTESAAVLFVAAARGRTPAADVLTAIRELKTAVLRQDQALAVPTPAVTVPRSTPAAAFAGRKAELASLDALLPDTAEAGPGTVVISAVSGYSRGG